MPFSPNPAIVAETGGDFPSLSSAIAAIQAYGALEPAEIIEVQCRKGDWDTTATVVANTLGTANDRYIKIMAFPGEEHGGVSEAGYVLRASRAGGILERNDPGQVTQDIETVATGTTSARHGYRNATMPSTGDITVDRCILRPNAGAASKGFDMLLGSGLSIKRVRSNIAVGSGSSGGVGFEWGGFVEGLTCANNTAFLHDTGYIKPSNRIADADNNIGFNNGTDFNAPGFAGTSGNNAAGDGTAPGTNSVQDLTTDDFANWTGDNTGDYSPAPGGKLDGTGNNQPLPLTAINLVPFNDPPSIGCYEIAAAAGTDVLLTWDDNSDNEDGFKVYRELTDGPWVNEIADLPADSVSYTDMGLADGTYYYMVSAYNAAGETFALMSTSITLPVGPSVIVEDTFSGRSVGTPLAGTSPDTIDNGEVWVDDLGGNFLIASGEAVGHAARNWLPCYIETGQSDVKASVTPAARINFNEIGVAARIATDDSYFFAVHDLNSTVRLREATPTNPATDRGSFSAPWVADVPLVLEISGSNADVEYNGIRLSPPYGSAGNETATKCGLVIESASNTIGNFKVEVLPAGPSVIVEDTFTGTSGTPVAGRLPDTVNNGNTYVDPTAVYELTANNSCLKGSFDASYWGPVIECGTANVTAAVRERFRGAFDSIGPNLRWTDSDNYAGVRYNLNNTIELMTVVGGSFVSRGSAAATYLAGTDVNGTFNGDQLSGEYNGVTVGPYTDTENINGTSHGFQCRNVNNDVDYFKVEAL